MKPRKQVVPEPITDQEMESAIKIVGPHVLLAKQSFETLAQRQLSNRDHYLILGLFDGLLTDVAESLARELKDSK